MPAAAQRPDFELTSFLLGRTRAWGLVEDRFGRVRRKFVVDMTGRWQAGCVSARERFTFDDGAVDDRTWRVVPGAHGHFTATCADCVGEARGASTGDTIRMRYRFRLGINGRHVVVDFDDRLHRVEDGVAINRATMRKWGMRVGELSLVFVREGAAPFEPVPGTAALA